MDWMPQAIREGILTILFISGPLVILAAGLGLAIGILQAATQIQEQTLASAVKIIGLFLALIVFGFFMFQYLKRYTTDNIERAFRIVPKLGSYILPRRNFLTQAKDIEKDKNPRPRLPEMLEKGVSPKAKTLGAGLLDEPDAVRVNENQSPDRLGRPKSQIKVPDENVREQPLVNIRSNPTTVNTRNQVAQPNVNRTTTNTSPAVNSAPQAQSTIQQPTITPPPAPERKSLTDSLSRIQNSINDFNRENVGAGTQP